MEEGSEAGSLDKLGLNLDKVPRVVDEGPPYLKSTIELDFDIVKIGVWIQYIKETHDMTYSAKV